MTVSNHPIGSPGLQRGPLAVRRFFNENDSRGAYMRRNGLACAVDGMGRNCVLEVYGFHYDQLH